MELVGEDLDDAIHNVRLGQRVAAGRELLQDRREDDGAVYFRRHVPIVELGQTDEVGPHEQTEFVALPFPPLAHLLLGLAVVRARRRCDAGGTGHVLDPHPQFVHLGKVLEEEGDGIGHGAPRCLRLAGFVRRASFLGFVLGLFLPRICRPPLHHIPNLLQRRRTTGKLVAGTSQQVVPQEQPADGTLDALDGPDQILQHGLGTTTGLGLGLAALEEDGSHQDLQVQPGHGPGCVLDGTVEGGGGVSWFATAGVCGRRMLCHARYARQRIGGRRGSGQLDEVRFQVGQLVEAAHVQLVVVLGVEGRLDVRGVVIGRRVMVVVLMVGIAQFAQHGGRPVQHHGQVVALDGLLHVVGVLLDAAGGVGEEAGLLGRLGRRQGIPAVMVVRGGSAVGSWRSACSACSTCWRLALASDRRRLLLVGRQSARGRGAGVGRHGHCRRGNLLLLLWLLLLLLLWLLLLLRHAIAAAAAAITTDAVGGDTGIAKGLDHRPSGTISRHGVEPILLPLQLPLPRNGLVPIRPPRGRVGHDGDGIVPSLLIAVVGAAPIVIVSGAGKRRRRRQPPAAGPAGRRDGRGLNTMLQLQLQLLRLLLIPPLPMLVLLLQLVQDAVPRYLLGNAERHRTDYLHSLGTASIVVIVVIVAIVLLGGSGIGGRGRTSTIPPPEQQRWVVLVKMNLIGIVPQQVEPIDGTATATDAAHDHAHAHLLLPVQLGRRGGNGVGLVGPLMALGLVQNQLLFFGLLLLLLQHVGPDEAATGAISILLLFLQLPFHLLLVILLVLHIPFRLLLLLLLLQKAVVDHLLPGRVLLGRSLPTT
mmetsp:Transcript_25281/g.73158  ORF Transcript_25281/g.73158 Transcript_25281/m.73158 type:complete len:813 (-) Transcript_25281:800-3238(-)